MTKALLPAMVSLLILAGPAAADVRLAPEKYVVFVHAGPKETDPKIKQVTGALFQLGYSVRSPDGEQDKVGGAGVDYFDPSAKETAQEIANLMNAALAELGLKGNDDQPLAPRFQRVKNPANYIGVWLFGSGAVQQRPIGRIPNVPRN